MRSRANSAQTTSASTRLAPGAVHTERQLRLWYTKDRADELRAPPASSSLAAADEIARMTLFLAADDSRMITKQLLIVDAGLR